MALIKRIGLVGFLVACAAVGIALVQCGGDTTTTTNTNTIQSADGGTQTTGTGDPSPSGGW